MDVRTAIYTLIAIIVCAVALCLGTWSEHPASMSKPEKKEIKSPTSLHVYKKEASPEKILPGGLSQDTNFTPDQLQQSQDIAIQFVKAYHNFDASNPLQNIQNSKSFLSDALYNQLIKNPSRGTLEAVKKQWTDVHVTETSNTDKTKIIWNVVVESNNTDNDGNTQAGEDWYLVQLEQVNNQFKVTGVTVDATD